MFIIMIDSYHFLKVCYNQNMVFVRLMITIKKESIIDKPQIITKEHIRLNYLTTKKTIRDSILCIMEIAHWAPLMWKIHVLIKKILEGWKVWGVAQTMYTRVCKCKNNKIKERKINFKNLLYIMMTTVNNNVLYIHKLLKSRF
jgi:uncharacterized phage-associated protein